MTCALILFSGISMASGSDLERFQSAWEAAAKGDHVTFRQVKDTLQAYELYPYLQYEDYRHRRNQVPVAEMSAFLGAHGDWAFTPGLRKAWLTSLAKKGRWKDYVAHSEGVTDTVLRCYRARGQIILGPGQDVLNDAQALWTVGKSQVKQCDPVFAWLMKNDGITTSIAWERVRLAMLANNRKLVTYLARFLPDDRRGLLEEWARQSRAGFSRLERLRSWPDNDETRMITSTSLKRLARKDAALAAEKFLALDPHFSWEASERAGLLRDIALYCAVELNDETPASMARVPAAYRDSQLLEWWARYHLSRQDWPGLLKIIGQMPAETRDDDRWQYWLAQAGLRSGSAGGSAELLRALADKANYYGFLAADELDLTYNICPLEPGIDENEVDRLAQVDGFRRALELRRAKLVNWAIGEWSLAANRLPTGDLTAAAALAHREGWADRVIFALGNSGDLRFYDWRFPLLWETEIKHQASIHDLDPAWVYGTIRSESALMETARSSANAMGLMQVTPATAKRVAGKHGLKWRGIAQLRTAQGNLPVGTAYMGDLLQDFDDNPVLVSGAYNAGPNAVRRWLGSRPLGEAAIWTETLPYFETRDYIPRVLAFTTIYDWRMGGTVTRISARMPHIESSKLNFMGSTTVECRDESS